MKYGADNIKICASGGVLSETDPVDVPQLTPEELRAIVEKRTRGAARWPRTPRRSRRALAVEAGVDSIEHGSFLSPRRCS